MLPLRLLGAKSSVIVLGGMGEVLLGGEVVCGIFTI